MRLAFLLSAVPLAVLLACGCGSSGESVHGHAGEKCIVQVRGDWLGEAGPLPINVGHTQTIEGKLVSSEADWIIILEDKTDREVFVAKEGVLSISFEPQAKK